MLFYICVLAIAFADPEDLTYPWTYAAVMGLIEAVVLKFMGGHELLPAVLGGAVTFVYMGLVLSWLSKQARYSFFWFVALALALLPGIAPHFLGKGAAIAPH